MMNSKPKPSTTKENAKPSLVPKLRFPEFRGTGGWIEVTLGQLSEVVRGGSPRPIDRFLTTSADGLNWLKIGDVDKEAKYVTYTAEKVRPEALSKTRVVNPGDLILSNSMSFGRPYILQVKTCIHDGWIAITDIAKKADTDFLYYSISAPSSQSYFVDNAAGGGVLNLNADIIKALPISYPSRAEQQKIASCLSSLDDLITAQAKKIDLLKTYKKGLMQQLFPREGETQPRLRFPQFRGDGEWQVRTLGELCFSVSSGRDVRNSEGAFDLYGSTGVIGKTAKASYDTPHILVARVGANAGYLTKASGQFGVTDNTLVIKLTPAAIIDYIFHYLGNININKLIFGSGQPLITGSTLAAQRVLVPSAAEQSKTSACLSSIHDLIEVEIAKLETLTTHKKGLMQGLFPEVVEVRP